MSTSPSEADDETGRQTHDLFVQLFRVKDEMGLE